MPMAAATASMASVTRTKERQRGEAAGRGGGPEVTPGGAGRWGGEGPAGVRVGRGEVGAGDGVERLEPEAGRERLGGCCGHGGYSSNGRRVEKAAAGGVTAVSAVPSYETDSREAMFFSPRVNPLIALATVIGLMFAHALGAEGGV